MAGIRVYGTVVPINGGHEDFRLLKVYILYPDEDSTTLIAITDVDEAGRFNMDLELSDTDIFIVRLGLYNPERDTTLFIASKVLDRNIIEKEGDEAYVEFEYDYRSNYEYGNELMLRGVVKSGDSDCQSFDKLLVRLFNAYDEAGTYFQSLEVDGSGNFGDRFVAPSRRLLAKLYVVNRDGSFSFVEEKSCYFESDEMEIEFNYDEMAFSYARPLIRITGLITPAALPCNSLDKLFVSYYDGYEDGAVAFDSKAVNSAGEFDKVIQAPSRKLTAKLFLTKRDGTFQLLNTKEYAYVGESGGPLAIGFDYDESLYEYGAEQFPISIEGLMRSAGCDSLDKIIVELYDATHPSAPRFDSIAVNSSGIFNKNITAPSRSLIVKALFVFKDSSTAEIANEEFYCYNNILEITFDYNCQYNYENINNSNMVKVKGRVVKTPNKYFVCNDFNEVQVRVYEANLSGSSSTILDTIVIAADGTFVKNVSPSGNYVVVALYYVVGGANILIAENGHYCKQHGVDVQFEYDETKYGNAVYNKIRDRINDQGGDAKLISTYNDAKLQKLSCLTCVSMDGLMWMKNSNLLWAELLANQSYTGPSDYGYTGIRDCLLTLKNTEERARALFFVLSELSVKGDLAKSLSMSKNQFMTFVSQYANNNIIDKSYYNDESIATLLACCRNAFLLNAEDDGRYYDAKIIHLSGKGSTLNSYNDKNDLLNRSFDSGGLAALISGDVTEDKIKNVIPIIKLSELVYDFAPFLRIAVSDSNITYTPNYYTIGLKPLSFWTGLMSGLATGQFPADFIVYNSSSAVDQAASITSYGTAIFNKLGGAQPTARLSRNLSSGSGLSLDSEGTIRALFSANPNFNIEQTSVLQQFVVKLSPTLSNEVTEVMMGRLQNLQLATRLTGETNGLTGTVTLINGLVASAGQVSSYSVVKLGQEQLVALFTGAGLSAQFARDTYGKALATNSATTMLVTQYLVYEGKNSLVPKSLNNPNFADTGMTIPGLPNLQSIFGSQNTCSCSECQSVYSPAAYLTDLLQWLKTSVTWPNSTGPNGLTAMEVQTSKNRRGDIRYLDLTCENTNVPIPYIDIVNEVLSVNLMPDTPGYPQTPPYASGTSAANAKIIDYKTLQTTKSAEQVSVQPEHRFAAAEALLKTAYYQWALPYDSGFDEATVYLGHLEKPYEELIRNFDKPANHYNTLAWANAMLNLNSQESALIDGVKTVAGNLDWLKYYGFKTADLGDTVAPASPFAGPVMRTTNLGITELRDVLYAYYINGTAIVNVAPAADLCDVDTYKFTPKFSSAIADRFMRFLRLKRKTGLSTRQLDLAIKIHSPSAGINGAFLIKLASGIAFSQKYKVPFEEVQVYFGDTTYSDFYTAYPAVSDYFKNTFQNPLLPQDVINFFTPGHASQVFTINLNSLTNSDKQKLSTVLGISIPAINAIRVAAFAAANPALTLANLSVFHRYSSFMKVFGIEAAELPATLALLGNPLDTTAFPDTMKALWDFAEKQKEFKKLNIAASELKAIVEGTGVYAIGDPDLDKAAEAVWKDLENAYAKSRAANPSKEFDTAAVPGTYLPLDTLDQTFFKDVIVENIRLVFGLSFNDATSVITTYSSSWLLNYIADPASLGSVRNWATRKAAFLPVFRLLNRIKILADLTGLDENSIKRGVDEKIRNTVAFPADHFYWVTNTYSTTDVNDIVWIKNVVLQAGLMNIDVTAYMNKCADYFSNTTSTYTTSNDTGIIALYDLMGAASPYKKLSVYEFTQTFHRAKFKDTAASSNDLISVMKYFEVIFAATELLHIKVTDAWSWIWDNTWSNVVSISSFSADIRRVLNTQFNDFSTWSEFIVPVQNGFRERLRDALVAYYLGQKPYASVNQLYSFFLLDTQMGSCMKISRVVSAISAAQLLVHRAEMGLEPDVYLDEDDKHEWEWRKNYRVWEANRKVFLYPENWIDPSLRTDKTYLFKEAEDLLQQDEINQKNSEQAYGGYLTALNEVSRLDVRAFYIESPTTGSTANPDTVNYVQHIDEILHVFGRSWNPPYSYYYRQQKRGVWQAWEKLEVEIDSDHLVPVIFNRKLYLFFPLFIEKTMESPVGSGVYKKYYEIQMCYTKFDFGKWSQKKILDGVMYAGEYAGRWWSNDETNLRYRLGESLNTSTDQYLGYVAWTNATVRDYTKVSMNKKAFYFYPEMQSGGDLIMRCRRDFHESIAFTHDGYSEMGFEHGFRISACDERVTITAPPYPWSIEPGQRYLARPYVTRPYAQQMRQGKDNFGNPTIATGDNGLWVKNPYSGFSGFAPNSTKLLNATMGSFTLTYPSQFKHNLMQQPFFYRDEKHSFYIKRDTNTQKFRVYANEHPFTCDMLAALNSKGIEGLLNPPFGDPSLLNRQIKQQPYFSSYGSATSIFQNPAPKGEFDFERTGPYALYNWEVFFHSVSLIARQLKQSSKFEDAVKWLRYIFDPANRDTSLQDLRYWKLKPFQIDVTKGIAYYIKLLSTGSPSDPERIDFEAQIEMWRNNPFDPHLIAGMRPRAYMMWTVMELIETITDWADSLFRQDTMESINEAINLYVIASEILGPRPKKVERPPATPTNFNALTGSLSAFSNAMVTFETYMVGYSGGVSVSSGVKSGKPPVLSSIPDLLFCIPDNPKLAAMWDRVEDRLYKIRHCMNIDGKVRELALFSPPIDPALLVRATAMGLDLSDVLADLASAPPHYRFSFLLQKANEFCNDVKSMGSQLLTALEKKDAEELSQFRQTHEQNTLKAARALKQMAIDEAKQSYKTLEYSKNLIQIRLADYQGRKSINNREDNAMRQTRLSEGFMFAEQGVRILAGLLGLIPDVFIGAPTATGAKVFGGSKLNKLINAGGHGLSIISTVTRNKASMSLTINGYERRQEDWDLQVKTAAEELLQVDRQLLGAEIRIAVAAKDLENHDKTVEQSAEMYDWLKNKYTNDKLYSWMAGQLKTLHRKAYTVAYDMAKLAQQAYFKELGDDADDPKINFGHWDSSRAGFFAGERLSSQLRELDTSYIRHNAREYELSKNISLSLLDPLALEKLKATGICEITIPELLFNLDHPSHYYRRIKSVSISMPCIAGANTNVNATLSLKKAKVRKEAKNASTVLDPDAVIVESIATSGSQNDSGLFELNFKDERYIPFEGKGAVSAWDLELTDATRQFDFSTLADVVIHMKYTAREGGLVFAGAVKGQIVTQLNAIKQAFSQDHFHYAFSLRHDMPNAWNDFKTGGPADVTILKSRLPYFIQALNPVIDKLGAVADTSLTTTPGTVKIKINTSNDLTLAQVTPGPGKMYQGRDTVGALGSVALGTSFKISQDAATLPVAKINDLVIVARIQVS